MALMTSLVALAIDAMLPAMGLIATDLALKNPNQSQLIISFLFLGLGVGQLVSGPLSDRFGRKIPAYGGLGLFMLGCLISYQADSLNMMLMGRVIQGLGLSAPRIVTMALVRDQFKGEEMARVMSFMMVIFIMVPAIAPAIGGLVISISHWRSIYMLFALLTVVVFLWFGLRQEETLPREKRLPFLPSTFFKATKEILGNRQSLGYILATGFVFAAFLGYLNTIQPVIEIQYGRGNWFPLIFALLALAIGGASWFNGYYVRRYGMKTLSKIACAILVLSSVIFLVPVFITAGDPPLWFLLIYYGVILFCTGILFGNLNSIAMEPLGHIAGIGSALVASLSTFMAVPLGTFTGQQYAGSVTPIVLGFAFYGFLTLAMMLWADRSPGQPSPG